MQAVSPLKVAQKAALTSLYGANCIYTTNVTLVNTCVISAIRRYVTSAILRQCNTFVTNVAAAPRYGWSPPLSVCHYRVHVCQYGPILNHR